MDFRKATDELCATITHEDVAKALGVSVQSIRQARLKDETNGHRQPPEKWESALVELAEKRVADYKRLIAKLRSNGTTR
jgi:hypothetical protein